MKLKEFFTKRGTQGKITDESFTKFVETIPDFDVPDEVDKKMEDTFLTIDRAKADKNIIAKARAEVYNIVDELIGEIMPAIEKIDKTLVVDISNEKDTLAKIKKLGPVLEKVGIKASGSQETEKIKEYEKEQEKLLKKINELNTESTKKEEDLKKTFEQEKKTLLLDHALKQKISKIDYADEHKEIRGAIDDVVFHALKTENHLSLNESGDFVVSIMENGIPKPKFNGNTQVTFDQVLEDKVKPYVKKNNTGGKETKKETPKHNPQSPTTGDTVQERRRIAYGGG